MPDRKYTLVEIDEMRRLIGLRLPQPFYEFYGRAGDSHSKQTDASLSSVANFRAATEDQLRTALTAGLGPEDFLDANKQQKEEHI